MSLDARAFRDAMGRFATGVTIVSTVGPDGDGLGVTVNSFNSVSLDPPLVLFSLSREASCFEEYVAAGKFAVNVLGRDHIAISSKFATPGESRWNGVAHETGETGCPVLPGALAVFECTTETIHDGGDHVIFIGRVVRADYSDGGEPLLYFRSRYCQVDDGTGG